MNVSLAETISENKRVVSAVARPTAFLVSSPPLSVKTRAENPAQAPEPAAARAPDDAARRSR